MSAGKYFQAQARLCDAYDALRAAEELARAVGNEELLSSIEHALGRTADALKLARAMTHQ